MVEEEGSVRDQVEWYQDPLEVEVAVGENHPLLQAACMGYTWVSEQQLEHTSWVAVVLTLRYWGSQKNGWSPSVQERGQEAHQCFWVAAKMDETLWKSPAASGFWNGQWSQAQPDDMLSSTEEQCLPSSGGTVNSNKSRSTWLDLSTSALEPVFSPGFLRETTLKRSPKQL